MPARDGCTSIFIITGLNHEACVAHGEEHVAVLRGKPVRGYVTVLARFISEQKLTITEDTPPPRHANILNWDVDLDAAKLQAMAIADNATYTPI